MPASYLSRLDTRSKMMVLLCGAVATIALGSIAAQSVLVLMSLCFVLLSRRYRLIGFSYLVMAFMMLLSIGFTALLMQWIPALSQMKLSDILVPFLRGITMMNLVLGLTLTSKIESVMGALTQLRLPFFITLPTTVMVRFIPTFAHDVMQVAETLKIRGWPLSFSSFLFHPWRTTRLLFIPILFRALRSSETLGIAAELKGLDSAGAVRMGEVSGFSRADYTVLALTVFTIITALLLQGYFPSSSALGM